MVVNGNASKVVLLDGELEVGVSAQRLEHANSLGGDLGSCRWVQETLGELLLFRDRV